ncbi:phosphoribosyl 1,2-cyclic phosphodiesterase [Dysgonomonas hofstadii]|uniref:Phosphoribosyl 1,2-cyclic phosphodiesterase n=1 Tax=Dysgonomonas hofstadii TaxID=637886 RepID=A0A840CRD1_9BACT|nr:MBL fold metallo-hydrolase [Dysgonomonas hofstadii]MBB4037611.1 phosphoribosyl 1,2-cyclic phosphodiesterase [Dysgonomonas hofstadii]
MQYDLFTQYKYKFFSLGSGSSGNCYYLGTKEYGILIDAGVGIRTVKKALKEYGVAFEKINAILITHDHADHIKTVGCFGDKHSIPVYTTETVHEGIQRNRVVHADLFQTKRVIEKEKAFEIRDFKITAFEVPHDSIDNVGYHIEFDGQSFVIVTDIGCITDKIREYASRANHLVIESNYDEYMLQAGRYPYYLKQRIGNGMGHLSNRLSADFIASIYNERLRNIWLCHLSQDNNRPELAYQTVEEALKTKGCQVGKHIRLEALSRYKVSGLREF